jgi:hypothetical protein
MRIAPLLLAALCLPLAPRPARAQAKADRLVLVERVDCRAKAAPEVSGTPKNAILIDFDETALSADEAWISRDKAGIIAAVNQLLSFYEIGAVRAREFSAQEAHQRFFSDNGAEHDVALGYWNNSFLVEVTNSCPYSGNTNGFPVCDEKDCSKDDQVYGPELRHYADYSCVQRVSASPSYFPGPHGERRARAYMAAIIVHEFIHAAHTRVIGDLLASEPASPPKACPVEIPLATAVKVSHALREKLGLPAKAMHMKHGLMTAGEDLNGDPASEAGGFTPNMGQCLSDPKVPAALFQDLRALASSSVLCTEKAEPVFKFFQVAPVNLAYINRHLSKAAAAGCHSACYYRLQKAAR